jgi:hypothetical protein
MTALRRIHRLALLLAALFVCRTAVLDSAHMPLAGSAARTPAGAQARLDLSSPSNSPAPHNPDTCPLCAGTHAVAAVSLAIVSSDAASPESITEPACAHPRAHLDRRSPSRAPPAVAA